MSKSVESITRALKLKADPKEKALSLRLGVRKLSLPFEVRTLQSEGYIFVHIPPAASILKVSDDGLVLVEDANEAAAAQASFRKPRARRASRKATRQVPEVPAELAEALKRIPSGHKLVFDASGSPRIVKARQRRK